MLRPEISADPNVSGPLGALALSRVTPRSPTLALRAVAWQRDLERLGVILPFSLVHDVGLLFAAPRAEITIGPRVELAASLTRQPGVTELLASLDELVRALAASDAVRRATELRVSDVVVTALLGRLLGPIAQRTKTARPYAVKLPSDASIFELDERDLAALFAAHPRAFELDALAALRSARLYVMTLADALDLDTLQLLGMLGLGAASAPMLEVDLLAALASSATHDIVHFSLDILPSVLETRAAPGASTHAAFGYAGVGRRGSVDGIVLTELAWDEDEFVRRFVDDELLYFTRGQSQDEARRLHVLLVDATASMRGDRTTFARGLALATAKKLVLAGEDVQVRFFDARLYDPIRVRGKELPTAQILSFRGERGQNPGRIFTQLAHELRLMRSREAREPVVHLFTHGANAVPRSVVAHVTSLARVVAVFIAPHGGQLELDYLDLLASHFLVTNETLAEKVARAEKAKSILEVGAKVDA